MITGSQGKRTMVTGKNEYPSTYFVHDQASQQECERVQRQDEMLTFMMGGVLAEQSDPSDFRAVLDVGCGSGAWLIEAAKTYPMMARLVGVDASARMIEYARAQAEAQEVADRVEFHVMDALSTLEFPTASFDLINQRMGGSYLRTWDWPPFLQKCQRIIKPRGVIRITECDIMQSNSPALSQLGNLFLTTFFQAGHIKTQQTNGLLDLLPSLFEQQGFQQIQTYVHAFQYQAGTREGDFIVEDVKHIFRTLLPFLQKWTRVPDDYEAIYQQALIEMQQPDFMARWNFLTIWGNSPTAKVRTRSRY